MITTTLMGQAKLKKIADLSKKVVETSGLAFYQNKYLITHNDGGHKSEIFVLNLEGGIVKKINVKDTKNRDWEDLAQDDAGRLYIGDFGNNANSREKCQIYILPSNFLDKKEVTPKKITFTYDCEAFFWKDDKLYLLTKCRTKPFTGESRVYEIPAIPGKHKAKYLGSVFLCNSGWRFCSVTSVDYHAKSNTLAILTYSKLYLISNIKGNDFWNGKVKSYSLPVVKQREAICFKNKSTLYVTDEQKRGLGGGNLYELKVKSK
jgi:sugar lactone lactonase YvrE